MRSLGAATIPKIGSDFVCAVVDRLTLPLSMRRFAALHLYGNFVAIRYH